LLEHGQGLRQANPGYSNLSPGKLTEELEIGN